eukprot:m.149900 g.149900  ORF g.149900 m.149900 type:complete len:408 (+) comp10139_c0_seq4:77-1300(+)
MAQPPKRYRRFARLPVHIVEDHDEALPILYRAIGSRHLPQQGVTLVHVDAHPDMQAPENMSADVTEDPHELFQCTSIGSYIVPAVYAGHVARVVWVRPNSPRCNQFRSGSYCLRVGKHKSQSGHIKTDSPEPYFVNELMYAPLEELDNAVSLRFDVCTASEFAELGLTPQSEHVVLDICLDFFATSNPFSTMCFGGSVNFSDVAAVFSSFLHRRSDCPSLVQAVRGILVHEVRRICTSSGSSSPEEKAKILFYKVQGALPGAKARNSTTQQRCPAQSWPGTSRGLDCLFLCNPTSACHTWQAMWNLCRKLRETPPLSEEQADLLIAAGVGVDLPEFCPTQEEMAASAVCVNELVVEKLSPILVTIARSIDDGFAPTSVIDCVLPGLLSKLGELSGIEPEVFDHTLAE